MIMLRPSGGRSWELSGHSCLRSIETPSQRRGRLLETYSGDSVDAFSAKPLTRRCNDFFHQRSMPINAAKDRRSEN